ncbi:hypothetical protein HanXRQr2_Chr06g0245431 [Helianthus annuus]|uniref:DUF4283 domain-containing protein n=1 Tax=Helianthus annuus TaxID=4232 RepID=A0A9K3IRE9_HELAN|nr:hypothetical protein HanXRQr2_Chr06g0245431 [Helianthus annuus]KAJ0559537.1 hypothetical protein HanHA300_Chr06g0201401 [Helianthus annuus]KAJ0572511.1 hypothetical protein HanHA89_Chr06g0216481 [Helianthus annuus]
MLFRPGRNFGRGGGGRPVGGFLNSHIAPEKAGEVKKGFSFADILLNRSRPFLDEESIEIDPSINTLSEVVGKAVVVRVMEFQVLRKLNIILWEAGFQGVEVWKGQSMLFECLAWINIFDVPPHLLSSTVFDVIGQKYGRIAQGSQLSESDDDLTYDRIGILTDSGNKISGIVNLRRQDKVYRVWVVEESDPWIPDFLNKDGSVGEDVSLSSEFSIPAHLSPVIGEKLNGVVEVMASGNKESNLAGGAAQQSVDVNEETIPREQENVGCQENYGCFNFAAHSAGGLDVNNGRPTLVDHWANLVGQTSPRPRKRPRNNDSGLIDELLNKEGGPGAVINNGNRDFNLNNSPRGNGLEPVTSSVAPEDGEIG